MTEREMILTSKETGFDHYGCASYRIEVDYTDPHFPRQRHIWTRADGTQDVEPWVRSIFVPTHQLLASGWTEIKESA